MKQKRLLDKISNKNLDTLKEKYVLDELFLRKNDYLLLIIKLTNIDKLMDNNGKLFDNLTSSLSMYLEEYLDDDFTRWNVYIIYVSEKYITREIKYKIENDTFFARKIVEDEYKSQLTDENITKLISKHIDFTDLTLNSILPKKEPYISTSEIYLKLKVADTISEIQIKEMLTSLERSTNEV